MWGSPGFSDGAELAGFGVIILTIVALPVILIKFSILAAIGFFVAGSTIAGLVAMYGGPSESVSVKFEVRGSLEKDRLDRPGPAE